MVKQNNNLDLVAEARLGSQDSMNQLAVCIRQRLYPYVLRVTADHNLSEDLLQEVLLAAIRCLDRLERLESFWPWIHGITRSKIQQHSRDRHRRDRLQAAALTDAHYHEISPHGQSVLECIVREEKQQFVCSALRQLKKQYRDVLQFYCFEQMSFAEIASATGCSCQQVRSRFFRARQLLRSSPLVARLVKD